MAKGRVRFYSDRCKACELCIKFCPKGALGLDKKNINALGYHPATVVDPERCTGCGTCALMCPDLVIEVERE
ncbi:4Fe-4S binding protein [Thermosyntropha sp.]|uniref:4Fe-4S binding protein n=1 Tax=Thermosyntropha sp. TaxID=2740820 RepID=UPI0025D8353D|nr:4Fe-4S binding protein [Thermosyntropha sp.]MBO8159533.1 4Fe-4S binding protein [Thermosyntropha sp.]